jgi:hypothetical protein
MVERLREEEKRRAAEAKKFRDETVALYKAGRGQVVRFVDWVGDSVFYPPKPKRKSLPQVAVEPPMPVAKNANEPIAMDSEAVMSETMAGPKPMDDGKQPVTLYDLSVKFTRDGFVDEFRYQRTLGREFLP